MAQAAAGATIDPDLAELRQYLTIGSMDTKQKLKRIIKWPKKLWVFGLKHAVKNMQCISWEPDGSTGCEGLKILVYLALYDLRPFLHDYQTSFLNF